MKKLYLVLVRATWHDLSIAESRESAGGPNVPRVSRGAALSHHTRTDINTWPRAICEV